MFCFGFFKGMCYGDCNDEFELYKQIKNNLSKEEVLNYLTKLSVTAVTPITVRDIFSGEVLEEAGIIEDGEFVFPVDFIYYYKKYDIGIPISYEKYIASKL